MSKSTEAAALAAVTAAYAEHARLCATGTSTDAELLAAFVATLRADHAMCIAFGDTAGAKALAAEVARAEMVRS